MIPSKLRYLEDLTGYSITDNYLGHGTQGVAFTLGNQVVKLTSDSDEVKVARLALKNPHNYLPKIQEIKEFSRGFRAIIREPLEDIQDQTILAQLRLVETIDLNRQKFHFHSQLATLLLDPNITSLLSWVYEHFYIKELRHFNFGARQTSIVVRDLGMLQLRPTQLRSKTKSR